MFPTEIERLVHICMSDAQLVLRSDVTTSQLAGRALPIYYPSHVVLYRSRSVSTWQRDHDFGPNRLRQSFLRSSAFLPSARARRMANIKYFDLILLLLPAQARGQLHRHRYGTCAFFSLSNHPCGYHQLQVGSDDRIYHDLKKRPHHKKGKTRSKSEGTIKRTRRCTVPQ